MHSLDPCQMVSVSTVEREPGVPPDKIKSLAERVPSLSTSKNRISPGLNLPSGPPSAYAGKVSLKRSRLLRAVPPVKVLIDDEIGVVTRPPADPGPTADSWISFWSTAALSAKDRNTASVESSVSAVAPVSWYTMVPVRVPVYFPAKPVVVDPAIAPYVPNVPALVAGRRTVSVRRTPAKKPTRRVAIWSEWARAVQIPSETTFALPRQGWQRPRKEREREREKGLPFNCEGVSLTACGGPRSRQRPGRR